MLVGLVSQFGMTIYHVLGKSNVVTNALLYHPNLATVVGSVEYSLLTWIYEAQAADSGDLWKQLKIAGNACQYGFMFHNGLLYNI